MEKNHKIIVIGLVIVIIALIAGIAYTMMGSNLSIGDGGKVPEGMKEYDFNSEFKMAVPENTKFLKKWENVNDLVLAEGYSYFDKDNKFSVVYGNSPMINHEMVNSLVEISNNSGNCTFDFDGELIIVHNVKADGKIGDSQDDSNFTESIILQRGHQLIVLSGNDIEFIKSMANTIKFYE